VSQSVSASHDGLWRDGAVIALAVTVHIDVVRKTLHEPHTRFPGKRGASAWRRTSTRL
jgi:hypothetical protein